MMVTYPRDCPRRPRPCLGLPSERRSIRIGCAVAALLGVALAVGVGALLVWAVLRPRSLASAQPAILVDGTCWFFQNGQFLGPCCEACKVQAMVQPLPPAPGDVALCELCCPQCGTIPVRRSFTLLELLNLQRVAEHAWADSKLHSQILPSAGGR